MVMVKYFPDTPARTLGNFACSLGRADTDVLAGDHCALADIRGSPDGVKCGKVDRTFPYALGRRSSAFGGALADISGAMADVGSGRGLVWT
jgi:hypothetical protein